MMRPFQAVSGFLLALVGTAASQDCDVPVVPGQYRGTPIPNTLPALGGAEITYFKIRDPSGQYPCNSTTVRADLSLINYMSLNSTGGRHQNNAIRRAVVIVHGLNRNAWTYEGHILNALSQVTRDEINSDSVVVMAPYFANGEDKGTGYPWNPEGEFQWNRASSAALVWAGSQWAGGAVNQYPPRTQTVSSYDALDQIVQWFGDTDRFPNMKQIVIAGHSLGAQMVHRYAAVGRSAADLGVEVPINYYIGNPNSFAWLSEDRPLPTAKCPEEYDVYREGYTDYNEYGAENTQPMTYGTGLVAAGREAIAANLASKAINHGRGTRDHGDTSRSCGPATTGKDRNERFFEFIKAFPATCPDPRGKNCDTVDYVPTDHNAIALFASQPGLTRLFYDNWAGQNGRAFDMGYPRQTNYDSPHPNPAREGEPLLHADARGYAGGMRY